MPNFKLTVEVNIYSQSIVILEADDLAQAEAALAAYMDDSDSLFDNLQHVDWEVTYSSVDPTDKPKTDGRAADWLN